YVFSRMAVGVVKGCGNDNPEYFLWFYKSVF
ncbi:MAG: hypothetical protein ACI8SE_000739, partial [Bacteroidia bacterium]